MVFVRIQLAIKLVLFKLRYPRTKVISRALGNKPVTFFSQESQDSVLLHHFYREIVSHDFPRIFLDVGCNQPILYSNSYFYEKYFDFQCYAVDPLANYISAWKSERSRAVFSNVGLGADNKQMQMTVFANEDGGAKSSAHPSDMFSTLTGSGAKKPDGNFELVSVRIQKTQDYLDENGLSRIGILSIDVEGFEEDVLRGIDFSKTFIFFAVIENNTSSMLGSDRIRKQMRLAGFDFFARIWGYDDVYVNRRTHAVLSSQGAIPAKRA